MAATLNDYTALRQIGPVIGHKEDVRVRTLIAQETIDLDALGATTVDTSFTIPAGALLISAKIVIGQTVVAGGTTVKVGLGISGGDVDAYALTGDLLANTEDANLVAPALLAAELQPAVTGTVTDGTAAGDTNITAGVVTVSFVYQIAE